MTTILAVLFIWIIKRLPATVHDSESCGERRPEYSHKHTCPSCGSQHVIKNASIHNGKQKHQCKDCGRQFVENPKNCTISSETKQLIDKLLLERISLRGIASVTGVSLDWLQNYVNRKMAHISCQITVSEKSEGRLTLECDEMWSFVGNKNSEFYIWLAIDRDTREIVGSFI